MSKSTNKLLTLTTNFRSLNTFRRPFKLATRALSEGKRKDLPQLAAAIKNPKKALLSASKYNDEKYAITFNCGKCKALNSKTFTKVAYREGLVMIRCDGCSSFHLIADNLKWFSDRPWNIEETLKKEGINLKDNYDVFDEADIMAERDKMADLDEEIKMEVNKMDAAKEEVNKEAELEFQNEAEILKEQSLRDQAVIKENSKNLEK